MEYFKKNFWDGFMFNAYLGGGLATIFNSSLDSVSYWIIMIPTLIISVISINEEEGFKKYFLKYLWFFYFNPAVYMFFRNDWDLPSHLILVLPMFIFMEIGHWRYGVRKRKEKELSSFRNVNRNPPMGATGYTGVTGYTGSLCTSGTSGTSGTTKNHSESTKKFKFGK